MTEDELIESVAKLWVENGGDETGIVFSWRKIKAEVEKLTGENEAVHDIQS